MPDEYRWALITGAGQRIGAHLASHLAGQGYGLHLHTRAHQAPTQAETLRREHGVPVHTHRLDLADRRATRTWAHELGQSPQAPALIVNNASPFPAPHPLDDLSALDEGLAVHLVAPTLLYGALPRRGGHVVHVLDARLPLYDGARPGYELSKHALSAHLPIAARRLAPRVRVNAIAPGLVLPPPGRDHAHLQNLAHVRAPLRTPARLEDLSAAVLFLEQAATVTGQILYVDSGEHLGAPTAPVDHAWQTETQPGPARNNLRKQ